jgi:ubiquinol-cytochrome c reductase core subunit 2
VGIDHEALVNYTNESFSGAADGVKKDYTKSDYVGGNEVRVDAGGTGLAHVGVVCKGANLYGSHDHVAGILEQLLGGGARIKWGSGSATARLNKAVATTVDEPFAVNAFNVSYSDNGLFGIYAVADGAVMGKVLKASMREFSEVAKGNFTSDDFLRAKYVVMATVAMMISVVIGTNTSLAC